MEDLEYSSEPESPLRAKVTADLAGQRLDAAAASLFPEYSRARLKAFIEEGRLTVNGAAQTKPRAPVATDDILEFIPEHKPQTTLQAQNLPLNVVYADAHLVIINKPAGLTVHPGAGIPDGTLQNALLHHWPQTSLLPRNGLVHRLDKDTTGLMVVALSEPAHTALTADMAARRIKREYDALVNGAVVSGGTVDAPIARHPRDRIRMGVISGGREAITHYRVAERFMWHTLLRVQLQTGRTHQIRVHMAHIKHPVAGDGLYGGQVLRARGASDALRAATNAFTRQALHAAALQLKHPQTGEVLSFNAERPADFASLLAVLRAESPQ